MRAEVIAIGDELASGERLDTNSQWLSQQLTRLGLQVAFHTTVLDDLEAMVAALRVACARAEIVVTTGGLGPTADDLTREAIAAAAGVALLLNEEQLGRIEHLFQRRGRIMAERNRRQAELPVGSRAINNPHGTAPGIDLRWESPQHGQCRSFSLPGVPAEMREMWSEHVEPAIREMLGPAAETIVHYCLKCFGAGESDVEAMLPDLIRRGRDPQVGITVSRGTITLRITSRGRDEHECRQRLEPTAALIREHLGELVFGEEHDELQHAAVGVLRQRPLRLATAECDSGGLLSQWLHEADPAGETFVGGLVLCDHRAAEVYVAAERHEFSSQAQRELAERLAQRARREFAADVGLALSPFPPSDAGHVAIGLVSDTGCRSRAFRFAAHPDVRVHLAVKRALDFLRRELPPV